MKKLLLTLIVSLFIVVNANAAIVTVEFEGTEALLDSVVSFQINYSSDSLLPEKFGLKNATDDPVKVMYTQSFTGDLGGAVPGKDLTSLDPTLGISGTSWQVDVVNNSESGGSNYIAGMNLNFDGITLVTGTLLTIDWDHDISLMVMEIGGWDFDNDEGTTFVEGTDYWVLFDDATNTYTITGTSPVPVPSAFLLLFTGLCSLAGLKRR
nr:hypothetical protein [uncultured Desulfobacter sp.]